MIEDAKTAKRRLSALEFLAALERSAILPDARCREVQRRFARRAPTLDSLVLAHQLMDDGTLTEFQARRLLWGKKRLSFGRYALVDSIGQGGRGRVFKARHRLMDRVVALKVMLPETARNEGAVSRFFREMKIVALLESPHVVRAIDADVHEGSPYIVMEYLEGDDLERVLSRKGPLSPNDVIGYGAQAARGLAHAHSKGVIHRDVKPTNLFLVKTGVVKILDLGCGELVGMAGQAGNVFDTDEGVVVGTTDFMSPEQVRNRPIDPRTDLFSLGCTMYRLLTGEYAFPGVTREDRLVKRIRDPHFAIEKIRPGLPDGVVTIVDRLLALRPDDRFASATEAAEALEALGRPAGRSERAPRPAKAPRPTPFRRCLANSFIRTRRRTGLVDDRIGTPSQQSARRRHLAPCGTKRAQAAIHQGSVFPPTSTRRTGRRNRAGRARKISSRVDSDEEDDERAWRNGRE